MSNSNDETDWTDDADLAVIEKQMAAIDSWLADRDPRNLVSPPPRGSLPPYQRRKQRESLRRALQPIYRRIGDIAEEGLVQQGNTWIIQLTDEQEAEFAALTEQFVELCLAHGYTKREGK